MYTRIFLAQAKRHMQRAGIILLLTVANLAHIGAMPVHADAAWLDPAWQQRQAVTVTSATTLNDYQVKIGLTASFDFASAQASGNDIRFTDSDGVSLLNYWIESYSAAGHTATIWVRVPTLPAGATTLYLYYANPAAPAASSGAATFPFFDDFSNPAWRSLPNMPFNTADESVAQVNGKFYIIGGYNNTATDPLNANYRFDPATNTYTQMAAMPTARWGNIAAAIASKIYVFGGQLANRSGSTANQVYDPATNTWATRAPLPAGLAKQGLTGCTDGSVIYLFYNNLAYRYDPTTDAYTQLAAIPAGTPLLSWASCSYVNDKIYVIGGYSGGAVAYNRIYNPATNSWAAGAPLPFRMYGSMRENPVVGDDIYVIQGQQADLEFSAEVYRYNTVSNTWTEHSMGPHAADGVAGASYNGKLYTFGGRQDGTGPYGLPFAAVYDPTVDHNQNWTQFDGNFEVNGGGLHRMAPSKGSIQAGRLFSQIQSTSYRTAGSFVLEAQGSQSAGGWSTLGIHSNFGEYNGSYTGYLLPYNDFGVSPTATSIYRENGTSFTKLASASAATGTQRFKVVSTPASLALYRGGSLIATAADTTYRNGSLSVITGRGNAAIWDFMFTRSYATAEPSVSLGALRTSP